MTKEQFFTFKSDFKKGMRIARLYKTHRKAYWNDGFATQEDQDNAIKKEVEEIKSLKDSIALRRPCKKWIGDKYVEDGTIPIVLGEMWYHHAAYYCEKHRLDVKSSIEYVKSEMSKMKENFWYSPEHYYEKEIIPILEGYEKIVCPDR